MKRDDCLGLMSFAKEVVKEFLWRVGIDLKSRVEKNKEKYFKDFEPNNTMTYQVRLLTYILERLVNIYILKNFNTLKAYDVIVTENKYNIENNVI